VSIRTPEQIITEAVADIELDDAEDREPTVEDLAAGIAKGWYDGTQLRKSMLEAVRLAQLPPDDEEILSALGQSVHTALRKGTESAAAHRAWSAIQDMPDWGAAMKWALWAMRASGYDVIEKEPRR
jgi:hypothetical protein